MTVMLRPTSLDEAVDLRHRYEDATVLAGGTDLMVAVNFRRLAPGRVLALRGVAEFRRWHGDGDGMWIGAGVTHRTVEDHLVNTIPALAQACRTVGSPAIRAQGTVGGNLATASPAGDLAPVLLALDTRVCLAGREGSRELPLAEFFTGPKRTALGPRELIAGVRIPRVGGYQEFIKVGTRNAMVIAIASVAVAIDPVARRVGIGLGSVGPTPIRARAAEQHLDAAIDFTSMAVAADDLDVAVGLAADACSPISDLRASADYRAHCIRTAVRRAVRRHVR